MHEFYATLALAGVVVLALGVFSQTIKRTLLSEPMVAMAFGVLVGPAVLGWLEPASWGPPATVLEVATRITLAIGLMGVALRIDHAELRAVWRPVTVLLTLGMLGMWALSTAVAAWWLPVGLGTALLIGAVVTPTDPIVASAIVTGPLAKRLLRGEVRDSLSLESGANDGLAFLLVMLPVLALHHGSPGAAFDAWLVDALLRGVLLAAAVGAAMGWAAAVLLRWTKARGHIEKHSVLSYTIALSLTTLGVARLLRCDALFAVFVAGLVFNLASDVSQQQEEENVQEAVNKLFTAPIFVLFGAMLPWGDWQRLGWPLAGFALTLLALRRPPIFLLLRPLLGRFYRARDMAYLGWFGPIGIAALFYAATAWSKTGDPLPWHLASAAVFASILLHGASAAPLTRAYGGERAIPAPAAGQARRASPSAPPGPRP